MRIFHKCNSEKGGREFAKAFGQRLLLATGIRLGCDGVLAVVQRYDTVWNAHWNDSWNKNRNAANDLVYSISNMVHKQNKGADIAAIGRTARMALAHCSQRVRKLPVAFKMATAIASGIALAVSLLLHGPVKLPTHNIVSSRVSASNPAAGQKAILWMPKKEAPAPVNSGIMMQSAGVAALQHGNASKTQASLAADADGEAPKAGKKSDADCPKYGKCVELMRYLDAHGKFTSMQLNRYVHAMAMLNWNTNPGNLIKMPGEILFHLGFRVPQTDSAFFDASTIGGSGQKLIYDASTKTVYSTVPR